MATNILPEKPLKPGTIRLYEFRIRRVRRHAVSFPERPTNADLVAQMFRKTFDDCMHREHFCAFHFDVRSNLIGFELIAIGSMDGVEVHPAEIFRGALISGARAIVVTHNHPSGDPLPSKEDDELTIRLKECGLLIGVPVLDHVVVADTRYFSYVQEKQKPYD